MSDSLQHYGLQHNSLPCSSVYPGVCSSSCSLSQWCYLTISFSAARFSSCLQSFPTSWSFPMSQLFAPGGQSIRSSASALVLPKNIQSWFPLGMTDLSPCCPRDSLESSPAPWFKSINLLVLSLLHGPTVTLICDYWKSIALIIWAFAGSDVSALSMFVIAFHPRSECLLISGCTHHSGDFGAQENKIFTAYIFSPSINMPWSNRTGCHDLFIYLF